MKLFVVFFLLLLLPIALGAYVVDQNKVGITAGAKVTSSSYQIRIGAEQEAIGESDSTNYITQVGWIYTLLAISPVIIYIDVPEQDANINSDPTIAFDVNRNTEVNVDVATIEIYINGSLSSLFNSGSDCTEFNGAFRCSYPETGLTQDDDNNVSFLAANTSGEAADQADRNVHYDVTAPTITSFSASSSGSDVVATWAGSDAFTGIETYYVRESGSIWIRAGLSTSYTFSGHASSSRTYDVKAKDFADNNSLISQATYTPSAAPGPEVPPGGPGMPSYPSVGPTAPKGIFEIEIVRIDDLVEPGAKLDFTYLVTNNSSASDNAYIEYWLEKAGSKVVSGSETVYLVAGTKKRYSSNLLLMDDMSDEYLFRITLDRAGQESVSDQSAVNVMVGAPTRIDLGISDLEPGRGVEPVLFGIDLGSNQDEPVLIVVEEKLFTEGRLIWEKKQTVAVEVFSHFLEEIYGLEPGKYTLQVKAFFGEQLKTVEVDFEKKPGIEIAPPVALLPETEQFLLPVFVMIPWLLLFLLLSWLLLFYKLVIRRDEEYERRHKRGMMLAYLTLIAIAIAIIVLFLLHQPISQLVASNGLINNGMEGALMQQNGVDPLFVGFFSLGDAGLLPTGIVAAIVFAGGVVSFIVLRPPRKGFYIK